MMCGPIGRLLAHWHSTKDSLQTECSAVQLLNLSVVRFAVKLLSKEFLEIEVEY